MRQAWVLVIFAAPLWAEEPVIMDPAPPAVELSTSTAAPDNDNLGLALDDRLEMESDEAAEAREKQEKLALKIRGLEAQARDARRDGKIKKAERIEKKIRKLSP